MPQRLHECLHDPNLDVAAIGPRPKGARLLMGMIVAAGLTLGALTPGQAQGAEPVPVASMPTRAAGAHWIELPRTIFLEVGKDADGRISAGRLVAAWQAAGLTAEQGVEVLDLLAPLTPVAMGVRDPLLETKLIKEAQAASQRLADTYPQVIERLASQSIQAEPNPTMEGPWRDVIDALNSQRADPSRAPMQPNATMEQARQALVNAAGHAGLRALRVPLGNWQSPAHLHNLADGLELANQELQRATGWEGRVLGLGGRIELALGEPLRRDDRGAEGMAFGGRDGRVQIIAQWKTLGHEWGHGLDYVLGRQLFGERGTLSDGLGAAAGSQWNQAHDAMIQASGHWQALREQAALNPRGAGGYWLDRSEAMAYAFSAWLTRTQAPQVLHEDTLSRSEREQPFRSPSASETQAQAPIFDALFSSLGKLDLGGQGHYRVSVDVPDLGQRIEQRRNGSTRVVENGIALGRTLR